MRYGSYSFTVFNEELTLETFPSVSSFLSLFSLRSSASHFLSRMKTNTLISGLAVSCLAPQPIRSCRSHLFSSPAALSLSSVYFMSLFNRDHTDKHCYIQISDAADVMLTARLQPTFKQSNMNEW